ncbi:hypothetical protein LHA31_05035 [Carnobacterium viridans]|uniref:hypothetical protein n=1 Tax=Carnobacterium viridans TaxID=174587 RepID=UPI000B7D5981|nr:hypothetical protein [Carnobacterium viridans]UDE96085.1 hypothetical protein LHA31_05035 [Carnobacterium viridans]
MLVAVHWIQCKLQSVSASAITLCLRLESFEDYRLQAIPWLSTSKPVIPKRFFKHPIIHQIIFIRSVQKLNNRISFDTQILLYQK